MTIDERVAQMMMDNISFGTAEIYERWLRRHLLEVARDQRHACAEAVNATPTTPHIG